MPSLTIQSSFACSEYAVDTCLQMEIAHKWIVKEHFSRTNKHADFQGQIIRHSTCPTNTMAMEELILHGQTKPVTATDEGRSQGDET
jgi:hypothetical protein